LAFKSENYNFEEKMNEMNKYEKEIKNNNEKDSLYYEFSKTVKTF